MRVDLAIQADSILRAHGDAKLAYFWNFREVFEPFKAMVFHARRGGPVPQRSRCRRCKGRSVHGAICRGCRMAEARQQFAAVEGYWQTLWSMQEPDFAPGLLDRIAERELEQGSLAARWPALESTVTVKKA